MILFSLSLKTTHLEVSAVDHSTPDGKALPKMQRFATELELLRQNWQEELKQTNEEILTLDSVGWWKRQLNKRQWEQARRRATRLIESTPGWQAEAENISSLLAEHKSVIALDQITDLAQRIRWAHLYGMRMWPVTYITKEEVLLQSVIDALRGSDEAA